MESHQRGAGVMTRRRALSPKPAEPSDGFMLFYRQVRPVSFAEDWAKGMMGCFDSLPPEVRRAINCAPMQPDKAAVLAARFGDSEAAKRIIKSYWDHVFKNRNRTGAHP
jgi:hypothetical protein